MGITGTLAAGIGMGGLTTACCLVAEVAITGTSQVSLREVLAAGAVVCSGVWWMSQKFQRSDDAFARLSGDFVRLSEQLEKLNEELASRPCALCVPEKKEGK